MNGIAKKIGIGVSILLLMAGVGWADVKYVFGVKGLSCPFCAYGLEKKLKKLQNVDSVSIDMNTGKVEIRSSSSISEEAIRKAVKEAGFRVSSFDKANSENEKSAEKGADASRRD